MTSNSIMVFSSTSCTERLWQTSASVHFKQKSNIFCKQCNSLYNLPILNSLLAMRISAFGIIGGGRQNWSLYAVVGADGDTQAVKHKVRRRRTAKGLTWGFILTLIVDVEEPALFVVAPETDQHLIGRAARWLVGLAIGEDSQFPGRLLRTVPRREGKMVNEVCLSVGIFRSTSNFTLAHTQQKHMSDHCHAPCKCVLLFLPRAITPGVCEWLRSKEVKFDLIFFLFSFQTTSTWNDRYALCSSC